MGWVRGSCAVLHLPTRYQQSSMRHTAREPGIVPSPLHYLTSSHESHSICFWGYWAPYVCLDLSDHLADIIPVRFPGFLRH